jgi:hypothetical protein
MVRPFKQYEDDPLRLRVIQTEFEFLPMYIWQLLCQKLKYLCVIIASLCTVSSR